MTHDPGAKHIWRTAGCHDIKTLLQAYMQEIDHRITAQMLEVTQSRLEALVYSTTIYYSISSWHGIKLSAGCGAFNLCSLFSDSPTTVHAGMLTPAGRRKSAKEIILTQECIRLLNYSKKWNSSFIQTPKACQKETSRLNAAIINIYCRMSWAPAELHCLLLISRPKDVKNRRWLLNTNQNKDL